MSLRRRFYVTSVFCLVACADFSKIANEARCRADQSLCKPDGGAFGRDAGADCRNCPAGSSCSLAGSCIDINECEIANGGCPSTADCINTDPGRACVCKAGTTGDGGTCAECNASTCPTGCCDGTQCIERASQTPLTCGPGGASCVACNGDDSCSSGVCVSVDQCANTWRSIDAGLGEGPPARAFATMVYDAARQTTLMFGGRLNGASNDLWSFKGNTWAQLVTSDGGAPSARELHAAAYDIKRSKMVVFGGNTFSVVTNDVWEWNGTEWSAPLPAVKPEARAAHALGYDAVRGSIVLFGGQQPDGGYPNDTWEWDGTVWSQKMPAISPPGRINPSMAFDPVAQLMVMFGGALENGTKARDTWLWDGINWTQFGTEVAQGTAGPAASYDPDHSRIVMFGYFEPPTDSTWEWDGARWVTCPDALPSVRFGSAMSYDVVGQRLLLFGGLADRLGRATPTNELYERAQ